VTSTHVVYHAKTTINSDVRTVRRDLALRTCYQLVVHQSGAKTIIGCQDLPSRRNIAARQLTEQS